MIIRLAYGPNGLIVLEIVRERENQRKKKKKRGLWADELFAWVESAESEREESKPAAAARCCFFLRCGFRYTFSVDCGGQGLKRKLFSSAFRRGKTRVEIRWLRRPRRRRNKGR